MSNAVAEIEKAVEQFYYNSSKHAEAHQWLTLAQVSPNAWTFCWELLRPDKAQEVQFFGANTLHLKISKFWVELQVDQYAELKAKLIQHIISYCDGGPRIVLTRLCVALSCFIIRTIPEHWTTAIPDILATLQPTNMPHVPPDQVLGVLLELITVLPEEFQSMTMAQSYRALVRNCLQTNLTNILPLVHQILSQRYSNSLRLHALRCLSSWVQFGIPLPECDDLLLAVLNCATESDLTECAVDVLTNIVIHPDTNKYSKSFLKLLTKLLQLEPMLIQAHQMKNMDVCSTMYNLFVSIGESHSRLLLEELLHDEQIKDDVLKLVGIILQCSGVPGQYPVDETCSSLPFSFWYTLQDDIVSAECDKSIIYMNFFGEIYESLIDILIFKVMYPSPQTYQSWSFDEKEEFRCYRQDIGDTLMYCYNLLREQMLERLHIHLQVLMHNSANGDISQALEACLYAFQSVAENVDLKDTKHVPRFFSMLPKLPLCNLQVISTALDAVGAYAEWISVHPEVLGDIIPLLTMGLNNPEVSPSATIALKDIVRDCQLSISPFAEHILLAAQEILRKGILKSHEQLRLMSAVGYVASVLPTSASMAYLNTLLTPYLQELQAFCQPKQLTQPLHAQLLLRLNMFSMLLATLDPKLKDCADDEIEGQERANIATPSSDLGPHPVLIIMQQLLPLLRQLGSVWKANAPISESMCELMKRAVLNLLDDSSLIVSDILALLLFLFQAHPNQAALDLLKQLIILFAKDDSHKTILSQTFVSIINMVLDLCQQGISDRSDVVEVFFQMLAQLLKKEPEFVLHQNFNLTALYHCGIAALAVPEAPVVRAATSFLVNFINYSRDFHAAIHIVNNNGESLLHQVLLCIGGESPRGVMDSMADVLLVLNKKYFDNLCRWMNSCLNQENFPSARITQSQKEQFIRSILRERTNKRKLQETVKEFTLLCRGLIGTEYAVQILPSL